jgi:hypothetical protein
VSETVPIQPPARAAPEPNGLLRESRAAYRAHRRRLLAVVLPVYSGLTLLGALNALLLVDEGGTDSSDSATVIAAALVLAGAFWTIPAVARALDDGRRGVTAPLRAQLVAAFSRLNTLSGLLLVSAAAAALFPTLLVARWALAVPVAVIEGATVREACRRSWRLTRRRTWRTLGLLVVTLVVVAAASAGALAAGFAVAGVLDVSGEWTFMLSLVISLAVAVVPLTLVSARIGTLWMLHYYRQIERTGLSAPTQPTATGLAGAVPAQPAGWWRRALAILVDLAVVGLVAGGLTGIVDAAAGRTWTSGVLLAAGSGVSLAVWLVYTTVLVGWQGQTIGKLAFGITVVRSDTGAPAGYRLAATRELARLFLCLIPLGTIVDHLSALSVAGKRTWHDRAVGTAVVRRSGQ